MRAEKCRTGVLGPSINLPVLLSLEGICRPSVKTQSLFSADRFPQLILLEPCSGCVVAVQFIRLVQVNCQ